MDYFFKTFIEWLNLIKMLDKNHILIWILIIEKQQKMILKKIFLCWCIMQFLEKIWKMWKNIEILNLSQEKKEETIWFSTKFSYYKLFHRKFITYRNEKKSEILMNKPVYLGLSILELSKILMYEFWYDYETKIWWKRKTMLYRYRHLHCIDKNRLYL